MNFSDEEITKQLAPLVASVAKATTDPSVDDALLSQLVRFAHTLAYVVERIRLKRGFKPILPKSKNEQLGKTKV